MDLAPRTGLAKLSGTMTERYHSPRRADAAAATRAEILARAQELFFERGYDGATVPEIARAARVAPQTVYASVGGKAAMFVELLQPAISDPTAIEAMLAALATDDPARVMALCAKGARSGQERYWDLVYKLMRRPPDDALAQQAIDNIMSKCLESLAGIAEHLKDLDALRPDLDVAQAVDALWFYFGQNAWASLVGERGWTFDRAEEWLRAAAARELLRTAGD